MKEVKVWKTDDGEIFELEEDAIAHQQYIDFWQELQILYNENHLPTYDLTDVDLMGFVVENKDKLKELFDRYPKMKQPSEY